MTLGDVSIRGRCGIRIERFAPNCPIALNLPTPAGIEAIAAVDRSISSRHERHLCLIAARRADGVVALVADVGLSSGPPRTRLSPGFGGCPGGFHLQRVDSLVHRDQFGISRRSQTGAALRAFERIVKSAILPEVSLGGRYEKLLSAYRARLFQFRFRRLQIRTPMQCCRPFATWYFTNRGQPARWVELA